MMKNIFFDGQKGFDIPVSYTSDFGWDVYGQEVGETELYGKVSAVYRAMQLNADAVGNLPFALVDEAGNDFDTSADYQNKIGFLPNPVKLFTLWHKSIIMTNTAYGLFEKQRGGMKLHYIVPTTVKPDITSAGLQGFWRQIQGQRTYYPVDKGLLIHLFKTDWDTEITPSPNTAYQAMMQSAGILYYSDYFVSSFFKRGGIKPHMLMVKGVPTKEERDRIESNWSKLIKGLREYLGKVYNAETIEAKPIGAGVDDFKSDNGFYKQALENIAMSQGIPLSLLLANSANYATARTEYSSWYDNYVIPAAQFMAGEINENLLKRFGLKLDFRPEAAAPNQEEEVQRASAFTSYAGVLMKNGHPQALSISAQLVGLDMPAGLEYEDLDERDEEHIPQSPIIQAQEEPQDEEGVEEKPEEEEYEDKKSVSVFVPNTAQIIELKTWHDIAERKQRKGEGAPEWNNQTLPADVFAMIDSRVKSATDAETMTAAFDLTTLAMTATPTPEYKASEIILLAEAINKLAERQKDV